MNDKTIIKVAAIGFIGLVIVPYVIGVGINVIGNSVVGISNLVQKAKYNKKIKDGLKDGSIVEIDGQYYEIQLSDPEEA